MAAYLFVSLFSYTPDDIVSVAANTAVANWGGPFGAWIADILRHTFGFASFLLVLCFVYTALLFQGRCSNYLLTQLFFSHFILLFSTSTLCSLIFRDFQEEAGGFVGFYFSEYSVRFLSFVPSVVVTIIINVLCLVFSGLGHLFPLLVIQKVKTVSEEDAFEEAVSETVRSVEKEEASVTEEEPMVSLFKGMVTKQKYEEETLPIVKIEKPEANRKMPWITKTRVPLSRREKMPRNGHPPLNQIKPIDPFPASVDDFAVPQYRDHGDEKILMKDIFAREKAKVAEPFSQQPEQSIFEGISIDKRHLPVEERSEEAYADDQYVIECAIPVERQDLRPIETKARITMIEETSAQPRAMQIQAEPETALDQMSVPQAQGRAGFAQSEAFAAHENTLATQVLDIGEDDCEDEEDDDDYEQEIVLGDDDHRIIFGAYKIANYTIPTYNFKISDGSDENSWMDEIDRNSKLLIQTLRDFGIDAKVVDVNRGPVITLYEIQIAAGIKVNKISALSDDIAMALAASRVRVVAPIPGKSAIGVEIPNRLRDMVTLGDILMTEEYRSCRMELKVALGKDILGKPIMLDLKRQPHLLIAGATGAGKSVCVNALISSLVVNYDPNFVRFIMIDPKMVELQLYNGLPHQLTNVITEPEIAPKALKWAIFEMERRYRLLSELNTRDIERYNAKIREYAGQSNLELLPYIVIIVDELADLMMVAPKEMENYITRIAQKARAVGIHLVLATQRPSVDVITGIIKANFPARIAFQVAQKTDSRTIIDRNGAEKLLGKGDMLYQSPTSSFPIRIQGAFVSEDEIMVLVKNAAKYGAPHHIDLDEPENKSEAESEGVEDSDDLFNEALKIVEETKKASASYLQRRLSIGYNRAARIIERMEELGYIGPQIGSKAREVYV